MSSAFFIHRPKFAIVIAIVMTLAGGLSIYMLPVNEYPAISPPNIVVSGVYPGASAEVVEVTVGALIEDRVNGVEDMIYVSSKSANDGSYALTVSFKVGADPGQTGRALAAAGGDCDGAQHRRAVSRHPQDHQLYLAG